MRSTTLVPVGPVTMRSPSGARKPDESLAARNAAAGARPRARARAADRPSATPPAASLAPSMPSVARLASTACPGTARPGPPPRPPRSPGCARRGPSPRTVTVVSPPASRHTGGGRGGRVSMHSRSTLTSAGATSRASPSRRGGEHQRPQPQRAAASRAAASTLWRLLPMTSACRRGGTRVAPGFGVSGTAPRAPASRWRRGRGRRVPSASRAAQHVQGVRVGGRIRATGGPGGDGRQVVAHHVRQHQRRPPAPARRPREPARRPSAATGACARCSARGWRRPARRRAAVSAAFSASGDAGHGRGQERGGAAGNAAPAARRRGPAPRPAAPPPPPRRRRARRGRGGRRRGPAGAAGAAGRATPTAMPLGDRVSEHVFGRGGHGEGGLAHRDDHDAAAPSRERRRRPSGACARGGAGGGGRSRRGSAAAQPGGQDRRGRATEPGMAPAARRRRSVPLPRVQLAQAGQRVEVLEEGLGDGGEIGARSRSGRGPSSACVQVRRIASRPSSSRMPLPLRKSRYRTNSSR